MTREWEPGDVAVVTNRHGVDNVAICAVSPHGLLWRYGVADVADVVHDHARDARPLVVIDPEDREQVERLSRSIWEKDGEVWAADAPTRSFANDVQAALRDLADPLQLNPEEPSGLGAVVEDRDGELWVRDKTTTTVAHWKRARGQMGGKRVRWSELDVVKVHFEGVAL